MGSEMCIRDRIRNDRVFRRFGPAVQVRIRAGGQADSAGAFGVVAVSYTHLTLPTSDLV